MANIFPIGPVFRLFPEQNGDILVIGNTMDENPSGAVRLWFAPGIGADAVFTVMGRAPRISTADTTAPWIPIPYRRVTLDNVASDYAIVSASVSGTSSILVPSTGGAVGLLVAMNVGEVVIYSQLVTGSTTP